MTKWRSSIALEDFDVIELNGNRHLICDVCSEGWREKWNKAIFQLSEILKNA